MTKYFLQNLMSINACVLGKYGDFSSFRYKHELLKFTINLRIAFCQNVRVPRVSLSVPHLVRALLVVHPSTK